jgi:hypothetical protein
VIDLTEALEIAAAARNGQPHQQVEPRHVLAVVEWGARLEAETMAMIPHLDRYDIAAVEKRIGRAL